MKQQSMKISQQLRTGNPSIPAMLQSRSRTMRKFSKQLKFLALGLILVGSLGLSMSTKVTLVGIANAAPTADPNCPTISGSGPLKANESYGFYAMGADSSGGANATVTMVGTVETDGNGCPFAVFFGFNDNGTACTGTFGSVIAKNASPANTGTMTWTPVTGCILPANVLQFHYANSPTSKAMYISNDGGGSGLGPDLVVAGKLQDDAAPDETIVGPGSIGSSSVGAKDRK
jgi:hypothetical protein